MKLSEDKFKRIKKELFLPHDSEADEAFLEYTLFLNNDDIARSICLSYEIPFEGNYWRIMAILEDNNAG